MNAPDYRHLLTRVVMSWDADSDIEFLAAIREARQALGFKLADEQEDRDEQALIEWHRSNHRA